MGFIEELIGAPSVTEEQRQAAVQRILSDPGIPDCKNTTAPFWLEEPHPRISKAGSTTVPKDVDILIIGSGITAASVARSIFKVKGSAAPRVAIIEARDICSGATGRNGGHVNEGVVHSYLELVGALGKENAMKIVRFRLGHLPMLLQVAQEDGLLEESQIRTVTSVVVFFDDEEFSKSKANLAQFKTDMPQESAAFYIFEAEDAQKKFHIPDAKGALSYPAGAAWPYKLIAGILDRLQDAQPNKFFLVGNAPVKKIIPPQADGTKFNIITSRGNVMATHVIHCTNAHVGHLVPGLRSRVVPLRGHMSAQSPGKALPDLSSEHSWSFHYTHGFDYLTQLPPSYPSTSPLCTGGEMMLGGGVAQAVGGGIYDMGVASDSQPFDLHTKIHLCGALRAIFAPDYWGEENGTAVKSMWTGNMGFSTDGLPFVGRLPVSLTGRDSMVASKTGAEWVAAGFSGEGMVHAWRSGVAVAQMVLEDISPENTSDWREWLPTEMEITEERIKDATFQPPPRS